MPGELEYFSADPNYRRGPTRERVSKDRGPGWYWHRGNKRYSKFTGRVDSQRRTPKKNINDPRERKRRKALEPHMADYGSNKNTIQKTHKGHTLPHYRGKF